MKTFTKITILTMVAALIGCSGGGGGNSVNLPTSTPPPSTPPAINLSGLILDGPVSGGTVLVFAPDAVQGALDTAESAEDRLASLNGASPLSSATLNASEDGAFTLQLSGDLANQAVFLVFDNTDAEDLTFGDTPFNMESVAVLGAAGSSAIVNVTPHTSIIGTQVRAALPLDAAGVSSEIQTANTNVISAFGSDALGNEIIPEGTDLIGSDDADGLTAASISLGSMVRATAAVTGFNREDVLEALAFDATDGAVDGAVSSGASSDIAERAAAVNDIQSLGETADQSLTIGSCAATTTLLRRACDIDTMDDFLEGVALCQDGPLEELDECVAESRTEREETLEECGEIFEARSDLCDDLDDAVHDPAFGEAFADNFVADPRQIGITVEPNPYLPLVQGNVWTYEETSIDDDGEEVTESIIVTVKNETKLIQGINCLVINDVVSEEDEVIEDTDDWYAQDKQGNVWYCGEISNDFEYFEDDMPVLPELVDIGGSWKSGREGAKAGILVPAVPVVGDVLRSEVFYGDAEDVGEVTSVTGDESTDLHDCDDACLVIRETTPLEGDADENSYYKAGVGVIVKKDNDGSARAELLSFTNEAPAGAVLSAAKLLIEHNATDEDTGFQGFVDGDPWNELSIEDSLGTEILSAQTRGNFVDFGVTEFFFETSEPPNAEVSIDDVVERLEEGAYLFTGDLVEGGSATRSTIFSQDIPAGPELLMPAEDAEDVDPANTVVSWELVTGDIDEEEITIVGYQVIVEQDTAPYDTDGFAKPHFSAHLPMSATSITIPAEFMVDDACYDYEVLAIEESGNQTLASASFETGDGCAEAEEVPDPEGLKAAKILIEHNATDEDTGFQGFADGNPWNSLVISDPNELEVIEIEAEGGLLDFGLTELFYETSEPENSETLIQDVLDRLPEGTYTFTADIVDGEESVLTATFTHTIPMGPVLVSPENEAEDVDAGATVVSWMPVTTDLDGDPVTIVGYQVIVEEDLDDEPFPAGFAEPKFSVFLPPTATSLTVPAEFMRADTDYAWEVLAIEASGNQTLSGAEFATAE